MNYGDYYGTTRIKESPTRKDTLLQAKSRYMREIQTKEKEIHDLKDSVNGINKQLDRMEDEKQGELPL